MTKRVDTTHGTIYSILMVRLYRAAGDDYVSQGFSFAECAKAAEAYLDNPGFGGRGLYTCEIDVSPESVFDATGMDVGELAAELGLGHPGAIGVDEWVPRTQRALDALEARGVRWVVVTESYPVGTRTWIYVSGDEPVLEAAS
jgi:hypothetical protein